MSELASSRIVLAKGFMRDLARFSGRKGVVALCLAIAAAFAEALAIGLVAPLLAILAGSTLPGRAVGRFLERLGIDGSTAQLAAVLGLIGLMWVGRCLLVWARDAAVGTLMIDFAEAQRRCVVTGLAAAPWNHLAAMSPARITHVIGQDVMLISLAAQVLVQAIAAGVMVLALAITALVLVPQLASIALALLAATGLGLARMLRRSHDIGALVTRANLHVAESSARFLAGLRVAASQNLQGNFVAQFDDGLGAVRSGQAGYLRQQSATRLISSSAALAVGAAVAVIGRTWLDVPLPPLAALIIILSRLGGPSGQIQQAIQQLFFALPAYAQLNALVREIGSATPEPEPPPKPARRLPCNVPIQVDAVSFSYPLEGAAEKTGLVLTGASLTLLPGEMIGLTGASGAGKSTLADLIVGLLTPGSGQVRVGELPIAGPAAVAWRDQIAYATQEPFLFRDSLRGNLTWGTRSPDDAAIWEALEITALTDTVRALPHGLETIIGDRGSLLSGGERQRLALARAVLRGGSLLILDEATSAIDIETEARVLGALRARLPTSTILAIAHRSETLDFCDRVARLIDGRIVHVR